MLLQRSSDLCDFQDERFPGVGQRLGSSDVAVSETRMNFKENKQDQHQAGESKPSRHKSGLRKHNDTGTTLNSVREESILLNSERVFLE